MKQQGRHAEGRVGPLFGDTRDCTTESIHFPIDTFRHAGPYIRRVKKGM